MEKFNIYNIHNRILQQDSVSVPWIQKEYGLSFDEALSFLEQLKYRGWIGEGASGISYKVLRENMKLRKIRREEVDILYEKIEDRLVTALNHIINKDGATVGSMKLALFDSGEEEEVLNILQILQLVYQYNDCYFSCVSQRTAEVLQRVCRAKRENERKSRIGIMRDDAEVKKEFEALFEE